MKVLSVIALVLFVSASSFAQTGNTTAEPAANTASAPAASAPAPTAKKKKAHKHGKKSKKDAAAE